MIDRAEDATGAARAGKRAAACLAIRVALAAIAVTGVGACRSGQTGRSGVRSVGITDVRGYLEMTVREREREQQSKVGAGKKRTKETIIEESLQLKTDGYVYHPNFLEFTLAGLFGLQQFAFEDVFGERKRTFQEDGPVVEFDLSANFFKKKNYPGSIFGRRYRAIRPRAFQSSLQTTTTNYGFVWQYISEKNPTSLQFTDTEVLLDPLDDREQSGLQKNSQLRFETAHRFNNHNELTFVYSRQSILEEPFALEYETDEMTVSHRLNFGSSHQHQLDSELNYFDQRGTFDVQRVRWREMFRLRHSDTLLSWYRIEIQDRSQGNLFGVEPLDERSYLATGTIEHRLYDSLVTQVGVFAQRQEFTPKLDINRIGAQLSFDYRKKNRWGLLLASYRARIQREDRTGGERNISTLDEQATFRDPEPVLLSGTRVDVGSILVTDEQRTTLFLADRDYSVRQVGDQIELQRLATGEITDGQTVLIDYVSRIGGDFTLDTINHDLSVRQNFDFGLSPYYRLRWQDQTISPAQATGITPDNIAAHIIGAEWQRGSLRLSAEFEDHASTISPFQATRLTADYVRRLKSAATLSLKVRWSDVQYDAPISRATEFLTFETRYRHAVTRHLAFEGTALYRRQRDSVSGDDEGIDVDLSLEWLIRQTEVRVTYEFTDFEDDFATNNSSTLYVQFRRRF